MKTREEIEQLAAREYWNSNTESRSFIKGYTQCQEDMADKKYTEDDMRKAILMARVRIENVSPKYSIDEIFLSLQTKTE